MNARLVTFITVGAFGFALGFAQIAGAFLDPPLQTVGERAQIACGLLVGGDVGIAGDEAAVGQGIAADFDHRTVAALAFVHVRLAGTQMVEPARDGFFDGARSQQTAARVVAEARMNMDGPDEQDKENLKFQI